MSATNAHPAAQSPARLLRPWTLLKRLRPVKVAAVHRRLREVERLSLGLGLLRRHFPAALAEYGDLKETGWWQVLAHLANLVEEAGWFEINWPVLNDAWALWMSDSEEEEGDHLAVYLHYVPVTLYGFSDRESLFEFPPMELLHALLAECEIQAVSSELLIQAELYDGLENWSRQDRAAAWQLLGEVESDPGRYPEPVRWLPELARWACHRTGNVMLDRHFDPYDQGPWFTWREPDLEQLRTAWRRAKPVITAFERLLAWYETDPGKLYHLASYLMKGASCEPLDW